MLTAPTLHALRGKILAAVIAGVTLTAAHGAAAKNHDSQPFRLPPHAVASHDRAPGPSLRVPD